MSWYNPFSWGQRDAEQYVADPNASTVGGPRHDYDARTATSQGAQAGGFERGDQTAAAQMLAAASRGEGPSGAGMAAEAQRQSGLRQANAIQAGRRGAAAGAGALLAQNAVVQNAQQAGQTEQVGRANEMANARGQYAQVGTSIAGMNQQQNQFNAGLQQNNQQFNASAANQVALANQAASLGISVQELQARMQQEQMRYGNLDPGQQSYFGQLLPAAASAAGAYAGGKAASDRRAKTNVAPYGDGDQQLMSIGQRRVPVRRQSAAQAIIDALGTGLATYQMTKSDAEERERAALPEKRQASKDVRQMMRSNDAGTPAPTAVSPEDLRDSLNRFSYPNYTPVPARMQPVDPWAEPQMRGPASLSDPYTGYRRPTYGGLPAYGDGGVVTRPTVAVVGEKGPEAIVPLGNPRSAGASVPAIFNSVSGPSMTDARRTLDAAPPYTYDYRPESGYDDGQRHAGLMAQDLERTPGGRQALGRDGQGYRTVDYARLLPLLAAGVSDVNRRLSAVEGRKTGGR